MRGSSIRPDRVAPSRNELYTVRVTHLTASDARQEFFRLLDAVEHGEAVVVERKGVRFRLSLLEPAAGTHPSGSASPVEVSDPDVLSGDWTWGGDENGQLQFRPRRKTR